MNKVEGLIAFYKLQEWWFSSFTENQREYIDSRYQPMGALPHSLTQGKIFERNQPAPEFLNGLNTWFRSKNDSYIAERVHIKLIELAEEHPIVKPGYFNGRHYTTYVRDFQALKILGKVIELENLLIELVKATESETAVDRIGVAPAYYRELAILYRKQKDYSKEISILERFAQQKHARGVMPSKLIERLDKVRTLNKARIDASR
jgi:hypothetical protein